MVLLVRTPIPHSTESLLGYVLRVSEENGYETPWHVLQLAGIVPSQMRSAALPVEKISLILGNERANLAKISYRAGKQGDGSYKILNHELGRGLKASPLRLNQPAFCPECVREDEYIDAFWDLNVAVACPRHKCEVLRSCHQCGAALSWFRPGLLTCRCGATFSDMRTPAVSSSLADLMAVVHSTLHEDALSQLFSSSGIPVKFLMNMPFRALLAVLEVLGGQTLSVRSDACSKSVIEAAAEVLENWPHGYHTLLSRLGAQYRGSGSTALGLRKQFEPFYKGLFKHRLLKSHVEFLREEFVRFGVSAWGNATVDAKMKRGSARLDDGRFMSKTEYARKFSVSKPTMDRMIADGTLAASRISSDRATRVVIDVERSRKIGRPTDILTDREAASVLALPVSVLSHLRNNGVYLSQPRTGYRRSWHREDVESFNMRGLALAGEECSLMENVIPLSDAMRLKLRDGAAKADIVAAVFDGRISVRGCIAQNLGGLLLFKQDLQEFVKCKRQEIEPGTCSLQEASLETGIDFMALRSAVDLGLLVGRDENSRFRICTKSVTDFNKAYVPLSRIANGLGTRVPHLLRLCGAKGIELIKLTRSNGLAHQPVLPRQLEATVTEMWKGRK